MDNLDQQLNQTYSSQVVSKDIIQRIKKGANIPDYILKYLLRIYCATDNETTILEEDIQSVKRILAENYVRPDEAEKVKSKIRELSRAC